MAESGIARFPLWKATLGGLYLCAVFTGMIWGVNSLYLLNWRRPLSLTEIILGCIAFPLYVSLWWASKNTVKSSWYAWLSNISFGIYTSLLLFGGEIRFLFQLLSFPWDWLVIATQMMLVLGGIILLVIKDGTFNILFAKWMDNLWILVILLGGGGAGGASFGMYAVRHGQFDFLFFLAVLILGVLGVGFLFGTLYFSWPSRPWAQEEE